MTLISFLLSVYCLLLTVYNISAMSKLIITGGKKLSGKITVSGSKNAALPIICASLLVKDKVILKNIPDIGDIRTIIEIIGAMGVKTKFKKNVLEIESSNFNFCDLDPVLSKKIRASILLVPSLLFHCKKVTMPYPGGCLIGARPIDAHIDALKSFGIEVSEKNQVFEFKNKNPQGTKIIIDYMSVTATEVALIAASFIPGESEIRAAAVEPEVIDLVNFLNSIGAQISLIGTHIFKVKGVNRFKKTTYKIIPDRIETGTFVILGALMNRGLTISDCYPNHLDSFTKKIISAGAHIEIYKDKIIVKRGLGLKAVDIRTGNYPDFPTDLQAPFAVLMTQAQGTSNIFETIFEGRLNYLKELELMGADVLIKSSHEATIKGPTPLFGKEIKSLDLRAGVTLILAALITQGTSEIKGAEIIDRGYENIVEKLRKLGAEIKREDTLI